MKTRFVQIKSIDKLVRYITDPKCNHRIYYVTNKGSELSKEVLYTCQFITVANWVKNGSVYIEIMVFE